MKLRLKWWRMKPPKCLPKLCFLSEASCEFLKRLDWVMFKIDREVVINYRFGIWSHSNGVHNCLNR
jgi:hypothetical protein